MFDSKTSRYHNFKYLVDPKVLSGSKGFDDNGVLEAKIMLGIHDRLISFLRLELKF